MGLGKLQSVARNQGHSDPVTGVMKAAAEPAMAALSSLADSMGGFFQGVAMSSSLSQENARLRALESSAALYTETLQRLETENDRLRRLLALPETPGKAKVSAAVIGYSPLESRSTLDAGLDKGIRKGMPVIANQGLYGIVQVVDKSSCQVLLISSARFRIVGMVQRDPPPVGFLKGQTPDSVSFEVLASKAVVQEGDMVSTSGFSERIPPGLPIGKIVEVENDEAYGSRRCRVFPSVQVGSVREVFILK